MKKASAPFDNGRAFQYLSESMGVVIGDTSRRKSDEDIYVSHGSLQTRLAKDYFVIRK